MTVARLQQLANVYNNLLRMQVSGENIIILGESLSAFKEIIFQEDMELKEKENQSQEDVAYNEETISTGN